MAWRQHDLWWWPWSALAALGVFLSSSSSSRDGLVGVVLPSSNTHSSSYGLVGVSLSSVVFLHSTISISFPLEISLRASSFGKSTASSAMYFQEDSPLSPGTQMDKVYRCGRYGKNRNNSDLYNRRQPRSG